MKRTVCLYMSIARTLGGYLQYTVMKVNYIYNQSISCQFPLLLSISLDIFPKRVVVVLRRFGSAVAMSGTGHLVVGPYGDDSFSDQSLVSIDFNDVELSRGDIQAFYIATTGQVTATGDTTNPLANDENLKLLNPSRGVGSDAFGGGYSNVKVGNVLYDLPVPVITTSNPSTSTTASPITPDPTKASTVWHDSARQLKSSSSLDIGIPLLLLYLLTPFCSSVCSLSLSIYLPSCTTTNNKHQAPTSSPTTSDPTIVSS
eukprot:scaffold7416_cov136-Alexandrium_tamarense.AAC.1